jgi:hypothetical protein
MDLAWERSATKWRHIIFAVFMVAILISLMIIFSNEAHKEWMTFQGTYNEKLAGKLNKPEFRNTPLKINQIWIPQLNAIDRCTTCHAGVENPLFANEPQPLTTHPGDFLKTHPVDKFGCTVCHQGDGQAVTVEATHGAVHHLNRQLLAKEFVQASCVKCHVDLYDQSVSNEQFPWGAIFLDGRRLTYQYGCRGCHKINGEGGTIGPELSGFGSRTELAFLLIHDFEHVEGPHIMRQWEYEHFLNPQKIVPGNPKLNFPPTIMPNFSLKPEQAKALTIYMLGLRNPKVDAIPYEYIAQKKWAQTSPPQPGSLK